MNSMLKQIREKYPNPVKLHGSCDEHYCVGGALYRFLGGNIGFPISHDLANTLRLANKNLSEGTATEYANTIISENDAGHFNDAWEALGYALSYGRRDEETI